jgi:hypothetical protein
MDCLTKQQLLEYVHGNKSGACEAHLADCASCRTELLRIMADENKDSAVSPELAYKTVEAVASNGPGQKENAVSSKRFVFPMLDRPFFKFAAAACLAIALLGGYFMIKGPFQHYAMTKKTANDLSVQNKKTGIGKNGIGPETDMAKNDVTPKKNTVFVFDSLAVRVGTIPVSRHREALMRFGKKTGIAASAAAVINVKTRTDTTAFIELTKGTALFSIEKNRYREFVVQTPTVRIVAIGTVFSVMADSAYTMVNVIEGSVKLEQKFNSNITAMLQQGDGAFVNRDSIINVMIENSQLFKARAKMLRDYIEGTLFTPVTGTLPGSGGACPKTGDDVRGVSEESPQASGKGE